MIPYIKGRCNEKSPSSGFGRKKEKIGGGY